jgi:putative solute:sodium symporter small subunit
LRDSGEGTWWRKTQQRALATVGGAILLSLAALAADRDAGPQLFGMPAGAFVAAVLLPFAILIAVFVFVARQRALDRRFDVAED